MRWQGWDIAEVEAGCLEPRKFCGDEREALLIAARCNDFLALSMGTSGQGGPDS